MIRTLRKYWPYALIGLLAVALVAALVWAVTERRRQESYRASLENIYERSFYELVEGIGNLEVKLSKLLLAETPEITMSLLSDIRNRAESTQHALSELPVHNHENNEKLVNQIGDYCNILSQNVANGRMITGQQREDIDEMQKQMTILGNEMRDIQAQNLMGQRELWEASLAADQVVDPVGAPLADVGMHSVEYPSLVYDGPFSDASDMPPKAISGGAVTYAQAEAAARKFVGESRVEWAQPTDDIGGDIPVYGVEMMLSRDGVVNVYVSKTGGHVTCMIAERCPEGSLYDLTECFETASAFLRERGYPEVALSYHQDYHDTATLNLIPLQDGVLLYPDLIKVQVSMETNQVIGIDTSHYLRNHVKRDLPAVQVSLEDALLLATQLTVHKTQTALIPLNSQEILCHEISGIFKDETYILYVDAVTGQQVDMLKIIDAEGGQLAM